MAEEVALEAHDIHEKLNELRQEQEKSESFGKFIQLIALATGLMAVCAAVAAQQAARLGLVFVPGVGDEGASVSEGDEE